MNCPLCGAPECPNNEDWNDCDQNLLHAGAELLAALKDAVEFISGHNECLDPSAHSGDKEWIAHCVALHRSCQEAINKAEGRGE